MIRLNRYWTSQAVASLSLAWLSACGNFGGISNTTTAALVGVASSTDGAEVAVGDPSLSGNALAQSFQLTHYSTISDVSILAARAGAFPSGSTYSLTATIETDNNDAPSGTLAATSAQASVPVLSIGTTSGTVTFTFNPAFDLKANTRYWLKIKANYPVNSSGNVVKWYSHDGSDLYPSGRAIYADVHATWLDAAFGGLKDMVFAVDGKTATEPSPTP